MELNLCLYCEKRLLDDNLAFCSMSCQSNEASKSCSSFQLYEKLSCSNTSLSRASAKQHTYSMSYHRSPSLSYSSPTTTTTTNNNAKKRTKRDALSSSLSAARPPFFLMQSSSTSSSFSSSLSDMSVFSTPCSCEDSKASNICVSYHITGTTQNIAS